LEGRRLSSDLWQGEIRGINVEINQNTGCEGWWIHKHKVTDKVSVFYIKFIYTIHAFKPLINLKINIQYIQYSIYSIFNIFNIQYIQYSIYSIFNIFNIQYIQYSIYSIFNIFNIQYIQYSKYSILNNVQARFPFMARITYLSDYKV